MTQANSTQQAPWTLVMRAGNYYSLDGVFVSDGTAIGTDFVKNANANQIKASSDQTFAYLAYTYADTTKKGLWALYDVTTTPTKLTSSIDYSSGITGAYQLANGYTLLTTYAWDAGEDVITTNNTSSSATFSLGLDATDIFQVDTARNAVWYAKSTSDYGLELYYATSTGSGNLVKDVYPGSSSGIDNYYAYNALLPNGNLLFSAYNGSTGNIWVSNGTESGTSMLDVEARTDFTNFGNKAAVSGYYYNGSVYETELFFTDGTVAGTSKLDVYAGDGSSHPSVLGTLNNQLYFTARDADGLGLFSTDGTTFTKKLSLDYDNVEILGSSNSIAYFAINDTAHGYELWAENLTTGNIALVKDIVSGTESGFDRYNFDAQQVMVGNNLVFTAYYSGTNEGLFVSDGTDAGTLQLSSTAPIDRAVIGNDVFFTTDQGVYLLDLSGGINQTLVETGDFSTSSFITDRLQSDSSHAFYLTAGKELKVVNTSGNSTQLADHVDKFKVVADNAVYFIETDSSDASSLWYSDGTVAGTRYIEALGDGGYAYSYYDLENATAIHTKTRIDETPTTTTGNDTITATSGNDSFDGLAGIDTISYQMATKAVKVSLASTTAQITGGSGTDTLKNIENIIGSNYADKLIGNSGNNSIFGMSGNDVIIGGLGADILKGGAGKDKFTFKTLKDSLLSNQDKIADFTHGKDKIDLSALDANSATKINDQFTTLINASATFSSAGQLKFSNHVLYANTDSDAQAEFAITLTGLKTLTITDIIV